MTTAYLPVEWGMDALHFAGRLRELRDAKGWNRERLAEAAGLSPGGVRDLEQGHRRPTWSTVVALCEALGVTPDAFIQEPAEREPPRRGRPRKRNGSTPAGRSAPEAAPESPETPQRGRRKRGKK